MPGTVSTITLVAVLLMGQAPSEPTKPLPVDVGVGRIAWFDLTTKDLAKSKEFYSKLFGWQYGPIEGTEYVVEILAEGTGIGTLRVAEGELSPFNGMVYVQVESIEASCARANELGATVVPGFPINLPGGIGAIAVALDPSGHPFGMYSRKPIPKPKPSAG